MRIRVLIAAALCVAPAAASAHHSFAVYFDSTKEVTITGKVTAFRFAETNAPVVLQRRGWTRDSIKAGETITIEGWPSRDGKPYIRLRSAKRADGSLIGSAPFGRQDQS